jgi:hypothetical protein
MQNCLKSPQILVVSKLNEYGVIYCCWFNRSCSSSSADLSKKAADSLYPVISCLTAAASVTFNLWGSKGRFRERSVGAFSPDPWN